MGRLASLDALVEKDLQGSSPVLVYGDLAEVLLDRIEDLLYLSLRTLLEEHLAQEVGLRMHHQLVEGRILEQ